MIKYLFALALTFLTLVTDAHEAHTEHAHASLAVSVAFDGRGQLWRASVIDGWVLVSHSADLGKTFSKPVAVNKTAQKIGADSEARPKIAITEQGHIYLTWTEALKKPFSGYIWFARSLDGGKTFETPIIVHQDRSEITHRFDALNVALDGKITVTWVDKRDLIAAKAAKKPYDGAAIYYAVSNDGGASFMPERKLADNSCECCRIALTNNPDGTVAALWRHVFEGSERDHMIAEIPSNNAVAAPKRATYGKWKVDGCPHHGAALASGGAAERWWGYHMAWFDGGNDDAGKQSSLFYARMDGVAWVSSPAKKFGNMQKQAGHPELMAAGEQVWLVWREKDAGKSQVWLMKSDDEGKSWGDRKLVVEAIGSADYPILLEHGKQVYLVWNTQQQGLKVLPL